ncbi:MAG TPA: hypothetical protein VK428_15615 [Acidimicrobiales bacterium]|nr:hypothetical protein [Acidimicrobiales bacterium]
MAYSWTLSLGFEPVDWSVSADEWLHCLAVCNSESDSDVRFAGHRADATTQPFIEVTGERPDRSHPDTVLLLLPTDEGLEVLIGGHEEEVDEGIVAMWATAVQCATSRLGKMSHEFEWTAIIGTPAEGRFGGRFALGAGARIGPFELTPGGRPLTQMARNTAGPSLSTASVRHSWPVLVRSRHVGFNWPSAQKRASFELRRLCALLSLDSDYHSWSVLEAPTPLGMGERRIPESGHPAYSPMPTGHFAEPPSEPESLWQPSSWVTKAWDEMARHPWLAHAVIIHHEGQLLDDEHPSLALVAYVSSIEAISNRLFEDRRCETCGSHLYVAARFRETLALVVGGNQLARLATAYGDRSTSVHQGRLHGSDSAPGSWGIIWNDPERTFDLQVVLGMRAASKALLVLAFSDGLPPRRTLPGS